MLKSKAEQFSTLNRRDFLKLGGSLLAGLLILPKRELNFLLTRVYPSASHLSMLKESGFQDWATYYQGRVIDPFIEVYQGPNFDSETIRYLWKDSVFPITNVYYNVETDSHNKVWYQIAENQYVHSGAVQPVNTQLNEPSNDIPPGGRLAEVTVPFTDAYWEIGYNQPLAYRLYHLTTHWVSNLQYDSTGEPWYTIMEDKWDLTYHVPARHLRLVSIEEFSSLSPEIPNELKRLEVRLSEQILIAYELNTPVFMSRVATGGKFRDGNFSTQPGHYLTFHKRPSRHMAAGNLAAGGYDLPGVPWISYFTESGVSIHGTYWHNNYGKPRSHGCINMTPAAAKWIYRWTTPLVPHDEIMVFKNYGTSLDIIEE